MSAQTYFTFTTPEEVIQRGEFFPYWEIRDEGNRFLMSRKPKDGEITIGTADHNNDNNLSLAEAINHFVTKGKGSFKFIRVKLGTNKNATSNHSYYAINLSGDNTEPGELLNGYFPQFTPSPSNPNMFVLNGMPNKNPEAIANPMQNLNELLEAQMVKMQAQYDKSMNELLINMERKLLAKEIESFHKQKAEWEANKEEQLNGAIQSATTYGVKNLMNDIPSLTGAVIDVIAAVQDLKKGQKVGTTLNGEKKETTTTKKEEKKRPEVQFSKKSEAKEETRQEATPEPTQNDSIFAGMSAEQIEAMKEMAQSLKTGKIHPDEVKEVAKEPTSFFEEDKQEDQNQE